MPNLKQGILAALVATLPTIALAQSAPISESLAISAAKAWTWQDSQTSVAQFDGPVEIELDRVHMSADSAVIWITPSTTGITEMQQVEIALVGNAVLKREDARRSGERLFVTAIVRGAIRVTSQDRLARDRSSEVPFQTAARMRDESGSNIRTEHGRWRLPRPSPVLEAAPPAEAEGAPQSISTEVRMQAGVTEQHRMPDGTMAIIANKGLTITIRRGQDQLTQLIADRGVLFTDVKHVDPQSAESLGQMQNAVQSVYLEGDVRILYTPKSTRRPDVQLEANQVFYEITTDRAVLTNAVMHTMDPTNKIPIVIRAQTIKQLSQDEQQTRREFRAERSLLTTSTFATPSIALAADRAYIKQYDNSDDWYGTRTSFSGRNTTMQFWGTPVFWLPYSGGSVSDRGFPLRSLDIGSSDRFGFFTKSQWGFFETIGREPPRDLELSYRADYLSSRGPAGGVDATYHGGYVLETTKQPGSFEGDLSTYMLYDRGTDLFGANRADVNYDQRNGNDFRGRIKWQHQQFLPDDWQVQMRYSYLSDPGFLEEYYPDDYHGIEPQDLSFYLKHQRDTEAITLLVQAQPNGFVTTQEYAQENFETERMPEVGYYRIGEGFADNALTFYSANSASRLHFQESHANNTELGIYNWNNQNFPEGIPAEGITGRTSQYVDRGDFRQEVTYPVMIDKFRVMPYVMGRFTSYSDSPSDDAVNRSLAGGGVRMTTAFWKVDDFAQSDIWDIHRVRHVMEPELNIFSSVTNTQPEDVFVFDEPVDNISDVSGTQIAMHQKWQTKRGAPDKMQNVDFFTWDTEANFFFHKNDQSLLTNSLSETDPNPTHFRGLFFPSAPETSITRNSINNDEAWRISDSTALLSDQEYNLEGGGMATGSVGMAVRRGDRTTYYVGERYINELNSNIASFLINYELSTKYSLGFGQSYDFGSSGSVTDSASIIRRFDVFYVAASITHNSISGESGFFITLHPLGLPTGIAAQNVPSVFGR